MLFERHHGGERAVLVQLQLAGAPALFPALGAEDAMDRVHRPELGVAFALCSPAKAGGQRDARESDAL